MSRVPRKKSSNCVSRMVKKLMRPAGDSTLEELSPEVLRIIGLCSRFLLRRNELVPHLFRLTPDFIF
jgi:hypothetical protein